MWPAFCVTDYKVQGSTLATAIIDLEVECPTPGVDHHRKYCSGNVQLSRLHGNMEKWWREPRDAVGGGKSILHFQPRL
jgi:hypothetical protein